MKRHLGCLLKDVCFWLGYIGPITPMSNHSFMPLPLESYREQNAYLDTCE
jgi:hypothetical protein